MAISSSDRRVLTARISSVVLCLVAGTLCGGCLLGVTTYDDLAATDWGKGRIGKEFVIEKDLFESSQDDGSTVRFVLPERAPGERTLAKGTVVRIVQVETSMNQGGFNNAPVGTTTVVVASGPQAGQVVELGDLLASNSEVLSPRAQRKVHHDN